MDLPLRACPQPGCPELVTTVCPVHPKVTGASSGAYDEEWRRVRDAYLAGHPFCWCGARASEVDHVKPVKMGGARLDPANLRSLCHTHHSRVTALTRARTATTQPRNYRRRTR